MDELKKELIKGDKPVRHERETHFAGYAELLYPDLARLFAAMYSYLAEGEEDKAKMVEVVIKDVLASRAYDLVVHALTQQMIEDHYCDPEDSAKEQIRNNEITDLKKWPE